MVFKISNFFNFPHVVLLGKTTLLGMLQQSWIKWSMLWCNHHTKLKVEIFPLSSTVSLWSTFYSFLAPGIFFLFSPPFKSRAFPGFSEKLWNIKTAREEEKTFMNFLSVRFCCVVDEDDRMQMKLLIWWKVHTQFDVADRAFIFRAAEDTLFN